MTDQNQKQLGKTLWAIADQLRGAMAADDHFPYATKMVPSPPTRLTLHCGSIIEESSVVAHAGSRDGTRP